MARVVLQNLVKTYSEKSGPQARAVNDVSLEIEDKEFMVLVGPSGCGKSTTLRMIAGLEEVSEGSVLIDGEVVNQVPPKDRDIAMVFQNYALYPHMSVYQNMAFGLTLRKLPKAEIEARVREAAAILGLEPYLDRKPKALSGGQRQRVALGRAIVRKPKVFLFDEPLSNLDAKMRVSTRAEISKLHERLGVTMIYVTHDQVEAMTMGDRICVMKDGRILQVAAPLELYNHPRNLFVAGFIGSPSMNQFRGSVRDESGPSWFIEASQGEPLRLPLPPTLAAKARSAGSREVVLGIRCEDLYDGPLPDWPEAPTARATVEVSEPMGAETYLYLKTAATSFVARVRPTEGHPGGRDVAITFDLRKAHLFDASSEEAL